MKWNLPTREFGKIVILILLGLTWSCAQDGNPKVKRVGLKPIEIRDSKAGSGVANSDDANGSVDATKGDQTTQDSVTAFSLTLYPKLKDYCGGCHAKAQPPLFAQDDKQAAHDVLIELSKVDFQDVEQSRIVLRESKENHNCPNGDCQMAAEAFTAAINDWVAQINTNDDDNDQLPKTATLRMSDASDGVIENPNPPGVIYFETEKANLKAPMTAVSDGKANGGMYVYTPMGSGNQNNVATATNQNTLGTITYQFDVVEAGAYQVMGHIGAPTATTNGFYVRVDGGAFQTWQFEMTGDDFVWDKADPVAAAGTPLSFNLTAGQHTIEIRQRREQARLDAVVLANDPSFDPSLASTGDENVKLLTYDISDATGVPGAEFTVVVSEYSDNAYMFRNPTLHIPDDSKVSVKGVKLYVNDKYLPQHATYTIVDTVASGESTVLSTAALVALKDKGDDMDEFSFEFEVLEKAP